MQVRLNRPFVYMRDSLASIFLPDKSILHYFYTVSFRLSQTNLVLGMFVIAVLSVVEKTFSPKKVFQRAAIVK